MHWIRFGHIARIIQPYTYTVGAEMVVVSYNVGISCNVTDHHTLPHQHPLFTVSNCALIEFPFIIIYLMCLGSLSHVTLALCGRSLLLFQVLQWINCVGMLRSVCECNERWQNDKINNNNEMTEQQKNSEKRCEIDRWRTLKRNARSR